MKERIDRIEITTARKQGRPVLLSEELDELTKKFIQNQQTHWMLFAVVKGIVTHNAVSGLEEHGGDLEKNKSRTFLFLLRHSYVKCKATLTFSKVQYIFDSIKALLLNKVREVDTVSSKFHPGEGGKGGESDTQDLWGDIPPLIFTNPSKVHVAMSST